MHSLRAEEMRRWQQLAALIAGNFTLADEAARLFV